MLLLALAPPPARSSFLAMPPNGDSITREVDPLAYRAQLRVGQVLRGKWRLDALLGVGSMATVFAATHRNVRANADWIVRGTTPLALGFAIACSSSATIERPGNGSDASSSGDATGESSAPGYWQCATKSSTAPGLPSCACVKAPTRIFGSELQCAPRGCCWATPSGGPVPASDGRSPDPFFPAFTSKPLCQCFDALTFC